MTMTKKKKKDLITIYSYTNKSELLLVSTAERSELKRDQPLTMNTVQEKVNYLRLTVCISYESK